MRIYATSKVENDVLAVQSSTRKTITSRPTLNTSSSLPLLHILIPSYITDYENENRLCHRFFACILIFMAQEPASSSGRSTKRLSALHDSPEPHYRNPVIGCGRSSSSIDSIQIRKQKQGQVFKCPMYPQDVAGVPESGWTRRGADL